MAKSLKETQEFFWRLITAPEGAEKGLAAQGLGLDDLDDVLRSDERMSALDRLDVYANMYFFRILGVLKQDFPQLAQHVGDTRFHNLATDYLLVHPSSHPSLRFIGKRLPEFLKDYDKLERFPCAADLAALEWARLDVFDAPDTPIATLEEFASLPPEQWDDLALSFVPALRILETTHPVHDIWKNPTAESKVVAEPTHYRVWRKLGNVVAHRSIDDLERRALQAFLRGETLGPVCVALAGSGLADADTVTAQVAQCLQVWVSEELIVGR